MKREVLIFGAGNIGRSFITPVFLDAGYTVYLADINAALIAALAEKGQYTVRICSREGEEERIVEGYHPLALGDRESLIPLLKRVPLVVTSVGQRGLDGVAALLGEILPDRKDERGRFLPLDMILAENLRNASDYCRTRIQASLQGIFPMETHLGLVETSIGKMVPLLTEEDRLRDPLGLKAEPYNNLILDRDAFVGPLPLSPSISLVSPVKAWVDRKLFIHNLGHAAAAYLGRKYFPGVIGIAPLMEHDWFVTLVRDAMLEGANILMHEYPDVFILSDLVHHIYDLLDRFANPALGDTVQRVGRDLMRKLGRNDRVVGAMRAAAGKGLPIGDLCLVYLAALEFGETSAEDPDRALYSRYRETGLESIYREISCGDEGQPDELDGIILTGLLGAAVSREESKRIS